MSPQRPELEARIRWNRLRIAGACLQMEGDIHTAAHNTRRVHRVLRLAAPLSVAAGVAWTLQAPSARQRSGRILGLLLSARTALRLFHRTRHFVLG